MSARLGPGQRISRLIFKHLETNMIKVYRQEARRGQNLMLSNDRPAGYSGTAALGRLPKDSTPTSPPPNMTRETLRMDS
jgi:hypothetical protein